MGTQVASRLLVLGDILRRAKLHARMLPIAAETYGAPRRTESRGELDEELTVDFSRETTPRDIVTVIATKPLTHHEPWTPMERGNLVIFRDGELAA